jgi:anti-sigma regulatory factor (Ser/Thr protein kinase)/GNAT superfamily N-acetyltransferase
MRTELTLPADARLLRLVQDYVLALAELAGIPPDQAQPLAQGVWEACHHCIACDFDADDTGAFTVAGELTPAALTLSVCDRGLPFDPNSETAVEQAAGSEDPSTVSLRGHGLSVVHQCADEVRYINHGPEGNELRFTKNLSGVCRLDPPPSTPPSSYREPTPQGHSQDYTIRLLQPADAIRVAQLMYRVYGYSYSNEDFYYPERLAHDLETGRHVGVVAVADNSEIVGHVGVERPDLGPLAELGQLAVAPAHRGQGLKKLMGDRLQEEVSRLGLAGLYGEAVTIHPISQESSEGRGLQVGGIKLLDWQARFKQLPSLHPGLEPETAPQRETMVFYFKYLSPPAPARVCAPSRHQEIVAKIYANLKTPYEFVEPCGPIGRGQLSVHYDRDTGAGTIQVNRIGIDTLPEIYQARRDLCNIAGAAVVGLFLPLAQGGTSYLCEAAEEDGFFLSGVWPLFAPDGDFLRLQYLNAELDLERVRLFSPFAQELLAYILREKERVRQGITGERDTT